MYVLADLAVLQDVKAANTLLLKDGSVKLADFGASVELDDEDERRSTIVGTPHFMSPGIGISHCYPSFLL